MQVDAPSIKSNTSLITALNATQPAGVIIKKDTEITRIYDFMNIAIKALELNHTYDISLKPEMYASSQQNDEAFLYQLLKKNK
ncbi:MAG: hypothetical protein H7259_02505 [Cytophagales bacterium]|nr:hypothetical protein [Cytophaga sp.]